MSDAQLPFYPNDAHVPESLDSPEFRLEPLRADHVELDYHALMEDPAYLRDWGQGSWPADDFTLVENLEDLELHASEHLRRLAFTYTVLNPRRDRCLGCVYINPVGVRIPAEHIPASLLPDPLQYTADLCFWVRPSTFPIELDLKLLQKIDGWLKKEWFFDRIFLHTSKSDHRQQSLFARHNLDVIASYTTQQPRPGSWVLYQIK